MSANEKNERFLLRIQTLGDNMKSSHYNEMAKEEFENFLIEVEDAKFAEKKTPVQYNRLKRFNVIEVCGIKKLVTNTEPMKYYVPAEEIYDIIDAAHISVGHGGRDRLKSETAKKYANITKDMINIFLSMCEVCQRNKNKKKRGLVSKPILHTEMNSRCQVDLIDMQSQEDRGHKFIMVYQDHLTKFVILRALTTKRAAEVAHHLMDIFLTFGAPCILHSDNGREFVNSIIKELASYWPELKLVNGKPRHSQSQGSVERANQDVEKMLASWMQDNKTSNWSNGLRFVQFMKNRALHSGIKQSPYRAMFGAEPKVGLTTSNLPLELLKSLNNEEDLEVAITEMRQNFEDNEEKQDDQEKVEQKKVDEEGEKGENQENQPEKNGNEESQAKKDRNEESQAENEIKEENKDQEGIINLNSKESLIVTARQRAHYNLSKQAKRMKKTSDQSHPPLKVGDNVIIKIPDVDKGKADLRNILGIVIEVTSTQLYKIGTRDGILDKLYCRSEFDSCSEKFIYQDEVPNVSISVRAAARKAAVGTGQGYVRCVCYKGCNNNRCLCKRKGLLCNSKCHNSLSCANK